MTFDEYYKLKSIGFVLAFVCCTTLQFLIRHHGSAKQDFKNWPINLGMGILNALLVSITIAKVSEYILLSQSQRSWAVFNFMELPDWLEILLSIAVLDLVTYFWHRANHRVGFLWKFHAVHHSDANLDSSSSIRFHFGEVFISFFVRFAVVFTFGISLEAFLVFEIVYQILNIFEHSNVRLWPKFESAIEAIFITPSLHRKHHSQKPHELNSNYGTIFSFWDRIFKTYTISTSAEQFALGLPRQNAWWGIKRVLLFPFKTGPHSY